MIPVFRRSLVTTKEIPVGHVFTSDDIDFKRPGTGISPKEINSVIGRVVKIAIQKDDLIRKEDLV